MNSIRRVLKELFYTDDDIHADIYGVHASNKLFRPIQLVPINNEHMVKM